MEKKKDFPVRMLIDPGSELSFITEDLVNRLRLKRKPASIPLLGIGGKYSGQTRGRVSLELKSIHEYPTSGSCKILAYVLPKLTSKLPSFISHNENWPHLQDLTLADPHFLQPGVIQLILGADCYGQILKPGIIKGNNSSLIAQQSIFGWIISGPIKEENIQGTVQGFHCSADIELYNLLSRFWTQEEVPTSFEHSLKPDEAKCEQLFIKTFSRDSSGRYIVRLPRKLPTEQLGDSFNTAKISLLRIFRQFKFDSTFRQRYQDFLQEYESLGHMQQVSNFELSNSDVYYLPHHGILREQNRTTKLRVVFNGSSQTSSGYSLNDMLYSSANLQADIFDVLIWIRIHKYLFSTDIEKMYRQIKIHPEDWDLQRILWYNSNEQLITYRLTTVTYGLNCAPFLALRTLQQLVIDEGHKYPQAVPCLERGRYMDDIFGGADSIQETQQIIYQLTNLCMAGGFPLQKWASNNKELLNNLSVAPENSSSVQIEESRIKILGLCWQPSTDTFHFFSCPSIKKKITKRTVLSEISQLFDPLGLLTPVLVKAKIFLQELWMTKLNWDDSLSSNLQERWCIFRNQLEDLDQISIPRWLGSFTSAHSVELHGFSDASQLAMAAAVYIRVTTKENKTTTNLVCSKTKVAPLKKLTIPKLELTAALLVTRLITHVQKALGYKETKIHLWTDSSVILAWITSHPSRWKDYVRNRVSIIQELCPPKS